jgi:hypothetical protein
VEISNFHSHCIALLDDSVKSLSFYLETMMTMMKSNTQTKSIATTAAVVLTMSTLSSAIKYPLQLDKLPDTGEQWQSLKNGNEFQPAKDLSPLAQEHLRRLSNTEDDTAYATSEYEKLFVDGSETYYDEYAQAWRALGFYIDCDFTSDYDDQDGGDNQGSGGCQRFMLWAAVSSNFALRGGIFWLLDPKSYTFLSTQLIQPSLSSASRYRIIYHFN